MNELQQQIIVEAVQHFGFESQLLKTVEECSELQRAVIRYSLGDSNIRCEGGVLEEMVDVLIMIYQLMIIFDFKFEEIEEMQEKKLSRLKVRIEREQVLK
jgi:NTP pyrophosphatase (non-canonical NTP hydrolase)